MADAIRAAQDAMWQSAMDEIDGLRVLLRHAVLQLESYERDFGLDASPVVVRLRAAGLDTEGTGTDD